MGLFVRAIVSIAVLSCILQGDVGQVRARIGSLYGHLPLAFEANQGQTDKAVLFLSRGSGFSFYLTKTGVVFRLQKPVIRHGLDLPTFAEPQNTPVAVLQMELSGGNRNPRVTGEKEHPGRTNYFNGRDPARWHTNIPNYGRVRYESVYPGIDLVYYGNQRQLEYDFVVGAGANPN